ncbi:hypothetical protein NOGI109294_14355 [Nocardiopsis gilva]|nr:hypothetical protein [Nocardiopsis gilva]
MPSTRGRGEARVDTLPRGTWSIRAGGDAVIHAITGPHHTHRPILPLIVVAYDPDARRAPIIVQPDINTFLSDRGSPPLRAGHPRSLMSAEFFAAQYEQVHDGIWRSNNRPKADPVGEAIVCRMG